MSLEIIVSEGRVADRTHGAIRGASLTADALEKELNLTSERVGVASEPTEDDWRESLPQARPTLEALSVALANRLQAGKIPLLVTNTCAASIATLPRVAAEDEETTLLWIDAHGDFNTPETTGSGYLGGMVLAAACGLWESGHGAGLDPTQVLLVGARDIDPQERLLLEQSGVRILGPTEASPERIREECGNSSIWVHIDWDVLEPGSVPAAYRVPDGLRPIEVKRILDSLNPERIRGIELAEFEASGDPIEEQKAVETIVETTAPLLKKLAQ